MPRTVVPRRGLGQPYLGQLVRIFKYLEPRGIDAAKGPRVTAVDIPFTRKLPNQDAGDLNSTGVEDDTIVRVNRQGDIEVRRTDRWDVIGGLLGNYEQRIKHETGLDWAE